MRKKKAEFKSPRSIFSFTSYKEAMRYMLIENAQWGKLSRAAEYLECQASFLTRVIKDKLHLTRDHAFNLAVFLKFSSSEVEYFLTLVDFERATDLKYKSKLKQLLAEQKLKYDSISERTNRKNLTKSSFRSNYFSNWLYTAIHFLVSVPKYQKIEELVRRLNIKDIVVKKYLKELAEEGFVKSVNKDRWQFNSGNYHLEKDSPLVVLHHQNWRTRAVIDSQDFNNESVHFTAVYTLSEADAAKLKEMMLEFISSANRTVEPSENEECIAICCDLFKV